MCSIEIDVLKIFTKFTGKHLSNNLFLNKVFSSEFREIFKNTSFTKQLQTAASVHGSITVANSKMKHT